MSADWSPPHEDRCCQGCGGCRLPTTTTHLANTPKPILCCWSCYRHTSFYAAAYGNDRVGQAILESLHITVALMVANGSKLPGVPLELLSQVTEQS